MTKTQTKTPKKYGSNIKVRLGMMTVEGDLFPIQYSPKKPKVSMVSPVDGGPVKQVYMADGGTIFQREELDRKVEANGEEFVVTDDELAEAKAAALDSAKNVLSLRVHDADAKSKLFPADAKAYILRPHTDDPENMQWYAALTQAMVKTDKVFVGEAKLSRSTGFFRAFIWNGHLVIQKHNIPSEVYEYEPIATEPSAHAEKMLEYFENMVAPFDAADYNDIVADAVATADEHREAPKPTATDIGSALDSFLSN